MKVVNIKEGWDKQISFFGLTLRAPWLGEEKGEGEKEEKKKRKKRKEKNFRYVFHGILCILDFGMDWWTLV